jgi:hypothetical protein
MGGCVSPVPLSDQISNPTTHYHLIRGGSISLFSVSSPLPPLSRRRYHRLGSVVFGAELLKLVIGVV